MHTHYMQRALELALPGLRAAMPNPSVGAVLVCSNKIIGEGSTSAYGGPHAEVNAIHSVKDTSLFEKSVLYVTLEPCFHEGKTPPCVDLILQKKIPKVVIGAVDPNTKVQGQSIAKLQAEGVEVIGNVLYEKCYAINKRFFTYHEKKRPYVILKWAQTADGFLGRNKPSHEKGIDWITPLSIKKITHTWRAEEMAILVGSRTALLDNPELTVRAADGTNPLRVVLDRALQIPADYSLFNHEASTLVLNEIKSQVENSLTYKQIDFSKGVDAILKVLYEMNIQSLIVEGGAAMLHSFIKSNCWDEARVLTEKNTLWHEGIKAPVLTQQPIQQEEIDTVTIHNFKNN